MIQEFYGVGFEGPDNMTASQQIEKQINLQQTQLEEDLLVPHLASSVSQRCGLSHGPYSCTSTVSMGPPTLRTPNFRKSTTAHSLTANGVRQVSNGQASVLGNL